MTFSVIANKRSHDLGFKRKVIKKGEMYRKLTSFQMFQGGRTKFINNVQFSFIKQQQQHIFITTERHSEHLVNQGEL